MSETYHETIAALRRPGPASDGFQEFVADQMDSLLADRARMEKALREAERELAFAVEHMGRTGGGYERALVSVRQALGASQ